MKHSVVAFFLLASNTCFAQPQRLVDLPFDIQRNIRGLDITITVKEIKGTNEGTFMKASFAIPVQGVLLRFEAEQIPFDDDLNFGPFLLKPFGILSEQEEEYLKTLMRPHGVFYKWKCNCDCDNDLIVL